MYFYILDPHNVPPKDFERQQTELQSLLTEFKITGEVTKVTPLRIIPDLVDAAAVHGARTLVACGTDETFHQMLACIKDRDFTLGFIPFAPQTQLGKILGMGDLPMCVKTIASRRIEKIDIARINDKYFISYLELGVGIYTNQNLGMFQMIKLFGENPIEIKMRIDDSYTISSKIMGGLIINTRGTAEGNSKTIGNPQDGFLDLLLIEKLSTFSVGRYKKQITTGNYEKIPGATSIRCQKIELLEPFNTKVSIDGKEIGRAPARIEMSNSKLKMIVGKNRLF